MFQINLLFVHLLEGNRSCAGLSVDLTNAIVDWMARIYPQGDSMQIVMSRSAFENNLFLEVTFFFRE